MKTLSIAGLLTIATLLAGCSQESGTGKAPPEPQHTSKTQQQPGGSDKPQPPPSPEVLPAPKQELLRDGYAQLTNWPAAAGGNGHFYQAFAVPGGIKWRDASQAATNTGGYLATATTKAENDFLFSLANKSTNFWRFVPSNKWYGPWLGAIQPPGSPEPAGGWTWVTGEAFTFQNWLPGQPNDTKGFDEDRIQFFGYGSMSNAWNDVNHNAANYVNSYIVEYDFDPRTRPGPK